MGKYLYRVGIACSVLLNVSLGGASNQTFSARNYVWQRGGRLNAVCLIDLALGRDHCRMAWVYWVASKKKIDNK